MAVDAGRLTDFATAILAHAGKDAGRAVKVAARLVGANLAGHDSHGVGMIPAYVDGILAGQLDAAADIELVQDKGPFLLVDGHRGFGHIVAEQAMTLAIDRAQAHHFAMLSLRNSFHLGRLGDWAWLCCRFVQLPVRGSRWAAGAHHAVCSAAVLGA